MPKSPVHTVASIWRLRHLADTGVIQTNANLIGRIRQVELVQVGGGIVVLSGKLQRHCKPSPNYHHRGYDSVSSLDL